ncbi:MAG: ABC transporter permease [Coriobacteriia bacterium]|nr:ABC transporter permease [Coriobacteriia bacterium]
MNSLLARLKRDSFVLTSLVSKDFKIKYRRSILGVLWSVLNPLFMMLVLTVVFSFIFRFEIENFPLYLILGKLIYLLVSGSTTAGLSSIFNSASLIKKIRINKAIFPVEKVIFEMVNFTFSLTAVVIVMLYFQVAPTPTVFLMPLLMIYVLLFCTGLSLILSALAVFFRDVVHLWSVFTLAWMYLSAIFYPVSILPEVAQQAILWNPIYQFITYFREIIMWGTVPSLQSNLICLGMALSTLAVGILIFRKLQKRFILYV